MIRRVYTLVVAGLPSFSVIKVVGERGVLGRFGMLGGMGTVSMTRKAKAFWIGSLAPVITLWVWVFVAWVLGGFLAMDYWTAFVFFTGPAIVVGGFAGMIASGYTSGPPIEH